jgi:hypothetical protein
LAAKRLVLSLFALAATAAPAWAGPGDMSVATFLAKADALKAKGILALGSPDIALLRSEGQAAGNGYRARLNAERKAGKPSSCPPKKATVRSDALMAHLRSYSPAAQQSTSMKTAMADYSIKAFPCR